MAKVKAFWISYDLGLKGDYSGMYLFLDTVNAKECGDSVAFFNKNYGEVTDYEKAVKDDIEKYVKLTSTDRIYLVYLREDTHKASGKFLYGGRKRSPWEGYATTGAQTDEDS